MPMLMLEGVALPDDQGCACTRGSDKEHTRFLNFVLDALELCAVRQQQNDVAGLPTLAGMYRSDDRAVETVFGKRQLDRGRVWPRRFLSLCISTEPSLRPATRMRCCQASAGP